MITGSLRIVNHQNVFDQRSSTAVTLESVEALHVAPAVVDGVPGLQHWELVRDLCRETAATGGRIPDAAIALEQGATFVTADHGVARFDGLRVDVPV